LFIKKFKNTREWLYGFFLERLQEIWIEDIPEDIKDELEEFKDNENDFFIQLANRLTLIEFFKYIFIRTYEDFQLIHKIDNNRVIPVTFWEAIKNIQYENLDDFREKYIQNINKTSFKDIWEQFFQGFSSLFRKYEIFIEEHILEWDSEDNEFDKDYNNRLFDILFFLNEFYFGWLESEWDDIIWRLYETSLERADRKRFGQFYTPRYIIDFILDELKVVPTPETKILDLSCWTGWFLMKYLSKINWSLLIDENENPLKNIFQWTYWIDIKMFSTLLTKLNLALIFIIKNKFLIERKLWTHKLDTKNIINDDGLEINKSEDKKLEKWSFDYVVWNPPYVWIKWNADIVSRVKIDWTLSQYFTKRSDLYYFFIIHWIEKLKLWWKFGYIFPREWMTADYANKLREYILEHTKILKLVDLNWISIFEDAWTTSCLLFLEKVEHKQDNNNFDFIQFKEYEWKNIIKYIDENSEGLQTTTTGTKKQKILSGFDIFSTKIMIPNNFDKIILSVKQNKKYDISFLWWLTTWKIILNDFLDVKEIKQQNLSDKPWIFWDNLPENKNIVNLEDILKITDWIQSWSDSVWKKHFEKWLAKDYEIWRWIFILKEEQQIRWVWLNNLRNKRENIGKIELNIYENWWWVELNNDEKQLIKPMFSWVSLNTWNINKNNLWIIYSVANKNYTNINNIKNHFSLYKASLLNRYTVNDILVNDILLSDTLNIKNLYSSAWSVQATLWRWIWDTIMFPRQSVIFENEKIITSSKVLGFTYIDKPVYWNGWWLGGLKYLFIDEKNKYTKIIDEKTSRADYLKFINAILNSKVIIDYLKENKFNSLSWEKLKELKIPKINFNDSNQVEKYNKIVSLADKLINIYSDKNIILNELTIKKNWNEIVEVWSDEYNEIMKSKKFEIIEDILFTVKIWDNEYYWFDNFKENFKNWIIEKKSIWEIFGLEEKKDNEIEKINKEIDELSNWFYYENDTTPEDWVEEKQGRLV
jgi:hypothetical protein